MDRAAPDLPAEAGRAAKRAGTFGPASGVAGCEGPDAHPSRNQGRMGHPRKRRAQNRRTASHAPDLRSAALA
jgi:hypothetical protein